jgi:hypothetical protein
MQSGAGRLDILARHERCIILLCMSFMNLIGYVRPVLFFQGVSDRSHRSLHRFLFSSMGSAINNGSSLTPFPVKDIYCLWLTSWLESSRTDKVSEFYIS